MWEIVTPVLIAVFGLLINFVVYWVKKHNYARENFSKLLSVVSTSSVAKTPKESKLIWNEFVFGSGTFKWSKDGMTITLWFTWNVSKRREIKNLISNIDKFYEALAAHSKKKMDVPRFDELIEYIVEAFEELNRNRFDSDKFKEACTKISYINKGRGR